MLQLAVDWRGWHRCRLKGLTQDLDCRGANAV